MDEYQQRLDGWRKRTGVAVVAAAVRLNGAQIWQGVSHTADIDRAELIRPHRFPIYSITKTFTAVCILQLAESGRLNLDDSVEQWMGTLPIPRTVSLRHLLQHTSGLGDYGWLPAYHDAVRNTPSIPWSDDQFFAMTLGNAPLFNAGTGWSYSNVGYLILRRIIERVTGVSFRGYVDAHIVSVLGLRDTFVAERIEDWSTCVPGYGREVASDGAVVDVRGTYHPGWCAPGVVVSTVDEVTTFFDHLFRGDLLNADSVEAMLRMVRVPGSHPPTVTPTCGLGILGDRDGPFGPAYGHGGQGPGYALAASILPHSARGRIAVAVFCNSSLGADVGGAEQALLGVATASQRG